MPELQQIGFDYGVLPINDAMELTAIKERINIRLKRTAEDIIEIGLDLIEAKKISGHGGFEKWLKSEFELSVDSAQNFMNVAKVFGAEIPNSSVFSLGAKVLYKLSAPSTPEAVRTEVLALVENGESVTSVEIDKLKKALKNADVEKKQLSLDVELARSETMQLVEKHQGDRKAIERAQMQSDNAENNYKELEKRFDHYVKQGVEEKLPAFQQQIEAQLSADFQAKIDSQTDEISRLKNQLNNADSTPAQIAKINEELRVAQEKYSLSSQQLDAINSQIAEKRKAIQSDEQINQGYCDFAEQLIAGVSASCVSLDVFVDFDETAQPTVWRSLCVIDDKTKRKLERAIETLQSAADSLQKMLNVNPQQPEPESEAKEIDHIDESFQSLGDFFLKWKAWRKQQDPINSGGNNFDWWFSRLMEEKSTKLKKHLSNFQAVWERYQFEIQAIN